MVLYAKTETVYVSGKAKWVKYKTPDEKFKKWSHVLYPNAESLEKIRELQSEGMKNQLKKDEDGYYVSLSRPSVKEFKGTIKAFTPPLLFDKDNQPFNDAVGNGSDITTKLEVYQHATPGGGKAKAARWVSSRIDNLIPYNADRDLSDYEKESLEGLKDQPEQLF